MKIETNTAYSYAQFINDRNNFRKVDFEGVNMYDTPTTLFFKLVFYFSDESGFISLGNSNDFISLFQTNETEQKLKDLQAPFSDPSKQIDATKDKERSPRAYKTFANTAINFLLMNDELERAELLKKFILLLSNINAYSPWYFKEVTGLDLALDRKVFTDGEFKIEEKPRQLTIKCLQDAYDDRIGTLLDLYRAICFSYQMKKEIVPANLRKFNMGILLFGPPIRGKGGKSGDKNNRIKIPDGGDDYYIPSVKMIEFRNCEFDYNSSKSAWSAINTEDLLSPEYTITINYDDAYEERYNEVLGKVVTDFITIDINPDGNRDSDIDMDKQVDVLYDIDKFTQPTNTRDDKYSFQLENGGVDSKKYWTDTREISIVTEKSSSTEVSNDKPYDPYTFGVKTNTEGYTTEEKNSSGKFGNAFTSQLNNISNKAAELIEKYTTLPSFENMSKRNIHDNYFDGNSTQKYGLYEYLNRISGTDGIVGSLIGQAAGAGTKFVKEKASKLYLGNIHGVSMNDILQKAQQAISGDISGMIGKAVRDNEGRKNDYKGNLEGDIFPEAENTKTVAKGQMNKPAEIGPRKASGQIHEGETTNHGKPSGTLPQYNQERTVLLGKINESQSIFNNL